MRRLARRGSRGEAELARIRAERLAVQLGGAAGTLGPLGQDGARVLALVAGRLGLAEPVVPWHTDRTRIAQIGAALTLVAGVMGKIGLDVALLAQTEVGEVAEGDGGGSSAMPQKQNPVGATVTRACVQLVRGHALVLGEALGQEHERATGAWHAEWAALAGALAFTGGAVSSARRTLSGLVVDAERMRANLNLTGGAITAERVAVALAGSLGRDRADEVIGEAAKRSTASGRALRTELLDDPEIALPDEELERLLDPGTYLGSAEAFVDRALEAYGDGA